MDYILVVITSAHVKCFVVIIFDPQYNPIR